MKEDAPYTKRELDLYFKTMKETIEKIDKNVQDIHNRGERWQRELDGIKDWSGEAKKIIEKNAEDIQTLKTDKVKIYTVIAVLVLVGAAVVTLGIYSLNTKIQQSIDTAFNTRFSKIQVINNN